jgi:hypothetical protein
MASSKETRAKYKPVDATRMVEERETGFSKALKIPTGVRLLKANKEGVLRLDFLPYEVKVDHNPHADKGSYYIERTYFCHKNIGVNEDTVICPAKTFGKPCPVCEKRSELSREGKDEMAKALRPKQRQLWAVIDLDSKDKDIQILDQSEHLFGKHLIDKIEKQDPGDNYNKFGDIKEGKTLKIGVRKETGDGMTWYSMSNIEFKDRSKPYDESILDKVPDLDACLNDMPYEKIKKLFLGAAADESEGEDEDKPGKPAPAEDEDETPPARSSKDEEDEDETPPEPVDGDAPDFEEGEWVEFEYKGETIQGTVVTFDKDNDLLRVKSDKRSNPYNVEPAEVTKIEAPKKASKKAAAPKDEDEDEKPAKAGKGGAAPVFKVGDRVIHKKHGECEIVKPLKDGVYTIEEDSTSDLFKAKPEELKPAK